MMWLNVTERIPLGHEGLNYYLFQYFFLNDAVFSGNIPQWMPYMTHGTVAMWFSAQASIGQNVMLLFAPLLKNIPFNYLFNFNMFIDQLILITGSWLLSSRYYVSPATRFFVVASISASAIWATQVWFNFHFYYCLPFIFYFYHRYKDSGKVRYCALLIALFFLQILGNAVYFFPMSLLVICLYIGSCEFLNKSKSFPLSLKSIIFLVSLFITGIFLVLGLFYFFHQDIVHYGYGRGINGHVTLDQFMTHGGNLTLNKWFEMIFGFSPALDFTLYGGILIVIFFIPGIKDAWEKSHRHLIVVFTVLLLIATGTFVAKILYFIWPMMGVYRHLALISPVIKIFIILIAGFGFERMIIKNNHSIDVVFLRRLMIFVATLIAILVIVITRIEDLDYSLSLFLVDHGWFSIVNGQAHLVPGLPMFPIVDKHIMFCCFKSILILGFCCLVVSRFKSNHVYLLSILLLVHILDVYGYKYVEFTHRTKSVSQAEQNFLTFLKPHFESKRSLHTTDYKHRASFLASFPRSNGAPDSIFNAYTFSDEIGSSYMVEFISRPLDVYLKAIQHQDWKINNEAPKGLVYYKGLRFPVENLSALKMSGFSENKIQFYKEAVILNSNDQVASLLTKDNYHGNVPLIVNKNMKQDLVQDYSINSRFYPEYKIRDFNANNLAFDVVLDVPSWIYVAQSYSPYWKVFIDDKLVPLFQTNVAYQAFFADKGEHQIKLRFECLPLKYLYLLWGLISVMALCVLMRFIYVAAAEKQEGFNNG